MCSGDSLFCLLEQHQLPPILVHPETLLALLPSSHLIVSPTSADRWLSFLPSHTGHPEDALAH